MKRLLNWGLTLVLIVSLAACGGGEEVEEEAVPTATLVAEEAVVEEAVATPVEELPAEEEVGTPGVALHAEVEGIPNVLRGTELADYNVISVDGEDLGDTEDLMINLETGEIDYVVLSFGGFLGIGGENFLIPWEVVETVPEFNGFMVQLTEETLASAPAFAADGWPDTALPDWDAEVLAYWRSVGATIEREVEETAPEVEGTPEITVTLEMVETPEVAGTPEINATAQFSGTPQAEGTAAAVGTPEMAATVEITGTAAVEGTPEATAAVEATPEIVATVEMTETAEVEGTPEAPAAATTPEMMPTAELAETPDTTTEPEGEIAVQIPRSVRLSVLLDYTVRNPEGEELGELEDLMINWREGRVAYAVLSFGEFLGMGGKWFAIPLTALTLNPVEQTVVLDIEREMLEAAPGFDTDNWPETASLEWDEEIRQYWEARQQDLEEMEQPAMETPAGELVTPEAAEATPMVESTPQEEAPPAEATPEPGGTATPGS